MTADSGPPSLHDIAWYRDLTEGAPATADLALRLRDALAVLTQGNAEEAVARARASWDVEQERKAEKAREEAARLEAKMESKREEAESRREMGERSAERARIARLAKPVIAVGADHSLALDEEGRLWVWGSNACGQLAIGRTQDGVSRPFHVFERERFVAAAAGSHTLAIDSTHRLWAWGCNDSGQLGARDLHAGGKPLWWQDPTPTSPAEVTGIGGAAAVAAWGTHSIAIDSEGKLWAWGANAHGQLGTGDVASRSTPGLVKGVTGVVAVATSTHSLAIDVNGGLWVWGKNDCGQLGLGDTAARYSPVKVKLPVAIRHAAAGVGFSVAVDTDGNVWAWGDNSCGQLGSDPWRGGRTPARVKSIRDIVTVAASGHALALDRRGIVWAWGGNGYGQLGLGDNADRRRPTAVPRLTGVKAIAADVRSSLASDADGDLWAWGDGRASYSWVPVRVIMRQANF
jgi:alpha-tubulin suppressor-like RCC1 family protein